MDSITGAKNIADAKVLAEKVKTVNERINKVQDFELKKKLIILEDKLDGANPGTVEYAKIVKEINNLGYETEKVIAETQNTRGKYQQEFDVMGQKQLNNLELQNQQDAAAKERAIISKVDRSLITPEMNLKLDEHTNKQLDYINNPEVPWDTRVQAAEVENSRPEGGVVYDMIKEGEDTFWFNPFTRDTPDNIKTYPIPKGLMFNGKPATGNEVRRRAGLANMSVEDYLNAIQGR